MKNSLKLPSVIIGVISILIMVLIMFIQENIVCPKFVVDIIFPIINSLASIAITAAIGTYLIEWKGWVSFVQTKLSEVLSEPRMVQNLSANHQEKLLSCLIDKVTKIDSNNIDNLLNNFYTLLREQSEIYGYYIFEMQNNVKCSIYHTKGKVYTDKKGIKYRVIENSRIVTYGKLVENPVYLENILAINVINEKIPNGLPSVEILSVRINSNKTTDYIVDVIPNSDANRIDTAYKIQYICKLKEKVEIKDNLKIEIRYKMIEPLYDISYCTRVKQLCQKFKINFTYDTTIFHVYSQTFIFGQRKDQIINDNSIIVDVDDWLMPGEGTCIFIEEK